MSARRPRLELASCARNDIRSIRAYSRGQWGEHQANENSAALSRGFETIRDNPEFGVAADDLGAGLRSFSVEQHRIIYRIRGETIRILRIIHHRQDVSRQVIQ
jgi:toxin ParE1/3/4